MYDGTILCVDETTPGICMTSFELQKMSHPLFHTNHSIYAVTSTSGMTSYSLYQTSHTLYLCHHNLSTDITPSLVSHQTHYMSDIICTIYNITSTPYFITYCTYDITPSIYETKSSMQGNIYTTHVTSQPLICVITHNILTASHPFFVWHHTRHMYGMFCTIHDITSSLYDLKPPFLWHHTHYIWHHIHCICVISSTVLIISHQLYLFETSSAIFDDMITIVYDITFTIFVVSQPLYLCHHTYSFLFISPFVCMTLHTYLYNNIYTI